jgi:cold shock CspA family protein
MGIKALTDGQRVRFNITQGKKGQQAENLILF